MNPSLKAALKAGLVSLGLLLVTIGGSVTMVGASDDAECQVQLGDTTFAHRAQPGDRVTVTMRSAAGVRAALTRPHTCTTSDSLRRWRYERVYHWRSDCPLMLREHRNPTYTWRVTSADEALTDGAIPCSVCANTDELEH